MLISNMIIKVKANLELTDSTRDVAISDIIQQVIDFCNLTKYPLEILAERDGITVEAEYAKIEIPFELEPFIRKKVKGIIDYEAENGKASVFDVKSIREGDTSITYNVDDKTSKETVYGLSEKDKECLRRSRRLRK